MANIKNIEKHKFKKGQTGNPNGRPRKFLADILFDLKAKGYAEIKPNNVSDVYQSLLGTPREELRLIAKDDKLPYIVSSTALHMLTKWGFDTQQSMLDRVHGKAIQKIEQSTKVDLTVNDPKKAERVKKLLWLRKKK